MHRQCVSDNVYLHMYCICCTDDPTSWRAVMLRCADYCRFLLLHIFGGIYADLDYVFLRSFDEIKAWRHADLHKFNDELITWEGGGKPDSPLSVRLLSASHSITATELVVWRFSVVWENSVVLWKPPFLRRWQQARLAAVGTCSYYMIEKYGICGLESATRTSFFHSLRKFRSFVDHRPFPKAEANRDAARSCWSVSLLSLH